MKLEKGFDLNIPGFAFSRAVSEQGEPKVFARTEDGVSKEIAESDLLELYVWLGRTSAWIRFTKARRREATR